MIRDHSRVAPSSMALTVACPLSLTLQEKVPAQPDTEEILEGEAAHIVAAEAARGTLWPVGHKFDSKGRTWTVDIDMHLGAKLYAQACEGPGQIEQPVHIRRIAAECWGTPDFWCAHLQAERVVRVRNVDYKYGHRYVDPFENWQGVSYMCGVCEQLGLSPGDDETVLEFGIVQPRAFHREGPVQWWRTTPFKLSAYVTKARAKVGTALGPNPVGETGAHCLDCKARAVCPLLRASAAHVVDFSGTAEMDGLDIVSAAQELRILREAAARLDARSTGLAVLIESEIRSGKQVPFWKLEPGQSNLKWLEGVEVDEVAFVGTMAGVNVVRPPELYTPTQCIKMGIDAKVIDQYANRPPAGLKLKPDDGVKLRKVFGNGEPTP